MNDETTTKTSKVTYFARYQNRNKSIMFSDWNVKHLDLQLDADVVERNNLPELLARIPYGFLGTNQSGVFEIQTDKGIWSREGFGRLNTRNAHFQTWEEMEAAENAERP